MSPDYQFHITADRLDSSAMVRMLTAENIHYKLRAFYMGDVPATAGYDYHQLTVTLEPKIDLPVIRWFHGAVFIQLVSSDLIAPDRVQHIIDQLTLSQQSAEAAQEFLRRQFPEAAD